MKSLKARYNQCFKDFIILYLFYHNILKILKYKNSSHEKFTRNSIPFDTNKIELTPGE